MNNERRVAIRLALMVLGGVAACAAPQSRVAAAALRAQVGPYELEVLVDGQPASTYSHRAETYLLGLEGQRYVLRVHNRSARRVEAVASVDGLDVIDGQTGHPRKRGYLVPAWGWVDIDGWRLSAQHVAAFRFAPVGASYAGLTGRARNVGVIGVAVFPERAPLARPELPAVPFRRFRPGEESPRGGLGSLEAEAPSPASPHGASAMDEAKAEASADESGSLRKRGSAAERPGLGTAFGEHVNSDVHEVTFVRAHPSRPAVLLGARYDDREGLVALGIDVDGRAAWSDAELRRTAEPFPFGAARGFARPPRGWDGD